MIESYWLLVVGWVCYLFGIITYALFASGSDRRHERRIQSWIAGRSYFDSKKNETEQEILRRRLSELVGPKNAD